MPTDRPDWVTSIEAQDVAARLASIATYDGRGDIAWLDDFEAAALGKWVATTSGTGASVALSTARARNGNQSCLLTTGSTLARQASILHREPPPVLGRHGLQLAVNVPINMESLSWALEVFTGARLIRGRLRWVYADELLQYENASGAFVTLLSSFRPAMAATLFHVVKAVVDLEAEEYVRVLVDDVETSMAGVPCYAFADTGFARAHLDITLVGDAGGNQQAYVDDVIYTHNEP